MAGAISAGEVNRGYKVSLQVYLKHRMKKSNQGMQCPVCAFAGKVELFEPEWFERLKELIAKYPGMGFDGDLVDMNPEELYGLYLKLKSVRCP